MKTVVLLVGAKGSGKTTIGDLLERACGIPFVRPEPLWLEHRKRPRGESWERDGLSLVLQHVRNALNDADRVVTETTGAADWFATFVDELRALARVQTIRLVAPPKVCLQRVQSRDSRLHIPLSDEEVEAVNQRALARVFDADGVLETLVPLDEERVLASLEEVLGPLRSKTASSP